jgi:HPr kinase/phosphorylase
LRDGTTLIASAPETLAGLIEAHSVGLLRARNVASARVALCVDLDKQETQRLPLLREVTLLGCRIPLIHGVSAPHFAPAILQILKAGRSVP